MGICLPLRKPKDETSGDSEISSSDDSSSESEQTIDKPDEKGKKGNIPAGVLGAENLRDMVTDLTPVSEPSTDEDSEEKPEVKKKGDVPGGVLGTPVAM